MSDIFDENNMIRVLAAVLPDGEAIQAAVHGVGLEIRISARFKNCMVAGEKLIPAENGEAFCVHKSKKSRFDLYIGITQQHLLLVQCERNHWLYKIDKMENAEQADAQEPFADVFLQDIGTCYRLSDIQSCEIKKVLMGAFNCTIRMKNGDFFKLQLPKRGGIGNGMPHHAVYRDAILARLAAQPNADR